MCDQQSLRSAWAYAQSDQSLCLSLEYAMTVKLPTEHPLKFLRLKGGCTASSESTFVKIPLCWKSHVTAQFHAYISECSISLNIHEVWQHRKRGGRYRQMKTPADHFLGQIILFYKKVILNTYN